jgi:hypothetical protein
MRTAPEFASAECERIRLTLSNTAIAGKSGRVWRDQRSMTLEAVIGENRFLVGADVEYCGFHKTLLSGGIAPFNTTIAS